ncbi:hypothetical protein [Methanoregula sp.]|uniref:hypothetical protein n=1 Tax=Methanoregula sp. TaxID=2052170 RepID=UPI002C9D64F6|nr:hypothetical protein [Methanoregula sp.]HVP96194.1 hypothetical protein [Methanoregula sp.]
MSQEKTPSRNGTAPSPDAHPADRIQAFFVRPFFLTLTIGLPFCTFKAIFGFAAIQAGTPSDPLLTSFGWLVVGWAAIDFVMNTLRASGDLLHIPTPLEYCTLAEIGRFLHRPLVFLAIDTLLSFTIICLMLWSGWITRLSPPESVLWYAATTLNLISISLVSLYNEAKSAGLMEESP